MYTSVHTIIHARVCMCRWKTEADIRCLPQMLYYFIYFLLVFICKCLACMNLCVPHERLMLTDALELEGGAVWC